MPVNRPQIEVADRRQIQPVRTPQAQYGNILGEQARVMGQRAAEFSQIMSLEAEERGKALVRAAVFSTGPNGAPQMPPDLGKEFGMAARRVYDAGMADRFAYQIGTAIENQINEAHNANLYDQDAFYADAQARLGNMAQDIPDAMKGMFQQIMTSKMVDHGFQVGRSQANLQQENLRQTIPLMSNQWSSNTNEAIIAGNDDAARFLLKDHIAWINAQPDHILNPSQRQAEIDKVYNAANSARAARDWEIEKLTGPQLQALIGKMINPTEDDLKLLAEYFPQYDSMANNGMPATNEKGEPIYDPDQAKAFTGRLYALQGLAAERDAKAKKLKEDQATTRSILEGNEPSTATNQALFNKAASLALNRKDANGALVEITAEDWRSGRINDDERRLVLQNAKQAGMLPSSLVKALRSVDRTLDDKALENLFVVFRDLREQGNTSGNTIDMSQEIGERALANLMAIDALAGDTGGGFTLRASIEKVDALREMPWTPEDYLKTLNTYKGIFGQIDSVNDIDAAVTAHLGKKIFGGNYVPEELAQAKVFFEAQLRLQHHLGAESDALKEATSLTEQAFKARWVDSEYMTRKSQYAPEKWYGTPRAESVGAWVKKFWNANIKAPVLEGAESVVRNPLVNFYKADQRNVYESDFGAALARATPFEIAMDREISKLVDGMSDEEKPLYANLRDFYEPKTQYRLEHDRSSGIPPRYVVFMRTKRGDYSRIGVVDPGPAFKDLTGSLSNFMPDLRSDRALEIFNSQRGGAYGASVGGSARSFQEIYDSLAPGNAASSPDLER